MKEYTAKTVEEAVALAAAELGIDQSKLIYEVTAEKKGLFKKSATISVLEEGDAVEFARSYLTKVISTMGIPVEATAEMEDDIIKVRLDSERNPVLIGRGGKTLQALNELTKLAVSNTFKKRYRVLLDVGGYKEDKYDKITHIAKRCANQVLRTHVDCKLEAMTPDERRIVHNVLSGWEHIKTESSGEGRDRAVTISFVE